MSEGKWTPGPWEWRPGKDVRRGTPETWPHMTLCGPESDGNPIIKGDRPAEEIMENGRLIAAAPEMAEALHTLLKAIDLFRPEGFNMQTPGIAFHALATAEAHARTLLARIHGQP